MLSFKQPLKPEEPTKASQAQKYYAFQSSLIEGVLEGIPRKDVPYRLGGIGIEKTLQVVEERALAGKCGNVSCRNLLEEDPRSVFDPNSVAFLSNGDIVNAMEVANFCSEDCYRYFQVGIVSKRPAADVWQLHQTTLENGQESKASTSSKASSNIIGAIKEKSRVKPPKTTFKSEPNPDVDYVAKKDTKKSANRGTDAIGKAVSFDENATVIPFKDERKEEGDDDSAESFENEEEDIKSLSSLLDTSLRVEEKIEKAGLSCFATVWDFLTRVVTEQTSHKICANHFQEWKADLALDGTIISERKAQLESYLSEGAVACDFTGSPKFIYEAQKEMKSIALTMDVSRPIPLFPLEHWILLSCILLSCLDDSNILRGYDFCDASIVKCFSAEELARISPYEFNMLKDVVKGKLSSA